MLAPRGRSAGKLGRKPAPITRLPGRAEPSAARGGCGRQGGRAVIATPLRHPGATGLRLGNPEGPRTEGCGRAAPTWSARSRARVSPHAPRRAWVTIALRRACFSGTPEGTQWHRCQHKYVSFYSVFLTCCSFVIYIRFYFSAVLFLVFFVFGTLFFYFIL